MSKFTAQMIPEVLNNFRVYDGDGDQLIGITNSMTLAEISYMTQSITGAGLGGSYNAAVIGHVESISQEIPFRALYEKVTSFMDPTKTNRINIRGAIQARSLGSDTTEMVQFRAVYGGKATSINPGTVESGAIMNASVTLEATYVLIEIGGEEVYMLNKLTNELRINGKSITDVIAKYC